MSNARGMPGGGMLKLRFDRYISGTGTRDEPLRTSALEARACAKIADFRSTEMSNVHLAGFSKTLPPNLQSCRDKNLVEDFNGTSI